MTLEFGVEKKLSSINFICKKVIVMLYKRDFCSKTKN